MPTMIPTQGMTKPKMIPTMMMASARPIMVPSFPRSPDPNYCWRTTSRSSREPLGAAFARLVDPLENPLLRAFVDHGPDVGLLVGRIAHDQGLDARQEPLEERVVSRALDVDPLHRDAALAGEGERIGGH